MPDVIIDSTRLINRLLQGRIPTGIDRVSLEYTRHFFDRSTALIRYRGLWCDLPHDDSRQVFELLLTQPPGFDRQILKRLNKFLLSSFLRPNKIKDRFFFNISHFGLEHPAYARRLRSYGVRPLFFVHDLIPITHPEYCRPGSAEKHVSRIQAMLQFGQGVICNSTATLRGLEAFSIESRLRLPPATVALLAVSKMPSAQIDRWSKQPYFVMLGTIEARKNHWLILHVWRQLIERHGQRAPKLLIIGQLGWECENVIDMLERCEALRGVVHQCPDCSDAEVSGLLRHSQALLFPSYTEGFGLPLVEALALDVPVIASDLPVFREVAGDVPDYLNPIDGIGWLRHIEDYCNKESHHRNAQLLRKKDYKPPSWAEHFAKVEDLMSQISA